MNNEYMSNEHMNIVQAGISSRIFDYSLTNISLPHPLDLWQGEEFLPAKRQI